MGNDHSTATQVIPKKVLKNESNFTCTVRDSSRELICKVTFQADSWLLVVKDSPSVLVRDDYFHYRRGIYKRQIAWRGMLYVHVSDQLVRCHFANRREEPFVEFVFKESSDFDRFVHQLSGMPFLHKVDHDHLERYFGKKRFASISLANAMLKQQSPSYLVNLAFVGFDVLQEHNIRTMEKIYSAIVKEVIEQFERSLWHMRYLMNYHKPDSTADHVLARFGEFVDVPVATSETTPKDDTNSGCPNDTNNNKGKRSLKKLYNSFTWKTSNDKLKSS